MLRLLNKVLAIGLLLSIAGMVYAGNFHAPRFDIALAKDLSLVSKIEEKEKGFYLYVFGSSKEEDANMQMRVIVSGKKPEANQPLEEFQLGVLGHTSAMFIDAYKLYPYLETPENKKVLDSKPNKIKIGNTTFAGITLYLGDIDAAFLTTTTHDMTYAFTLISKNSDAQVRKSKLKILMDQLPSLKFN